LPTVMRWQWKSGSKSSCKC